MRPSGVIVDAPVFDDQLTLLHAVEDLSTQAFVSEFYSVLPASLQADAMLFLFPCITSICRSFVTNCWAANFFLGIFFSSPGQILSFRLVQKKPVRSTERDQNTCSKRD